MLHHRKSYIGIRDEASYRRDWEGKEVVIRPLPMRQEINEAMGEHPDKERQCWFVEHSGQGETGADNDQRMHSNRHSMQR